MNIDELDKIMKRERRKQNEIAEVLGISRSAWFRKRKGISEFTLGEVQRLVKFLRMNRTDIMVVFFNPKVS